MTDDIVRHRRPSERGGDIAGIDVNWNSGEEWNGPDYAGYPIPDEGKRPKFEWDMRERRAYLLDLLNKRGHPDRLPKQADLAEDFNVSQQQISKDLQQIRDYIRYHAGDTAITQTEMVARKAVREELEEGNWSKALDNQLKYNDWLFDLGRLEKAPERKEIQEFSLEAKASDLTDEEHEHLKSLSQKLSSTTREAEDEEIVVEAKEAGE